MAGYLLKGQRAVRLIAFQGTEGNHSDGAIAVNAMGVDDPNPHLAGRPQVGFNNWIDARHDKVQDLVPNPDGFLGWMQWNDVWLKS